MTQKCFTINVSNCEYEANDKVYLLEEERDFFRGQVLKLNQEVNGYVEENKSLKKKVFDLEDEISSYKAVTFSSRRLT